MLLLRFAAKGLGTGGHLRELDCPADPGFLGETAPDGGSGGRGRAGDGLTKGLPQTVQAVLALVCLMLSLPFLAIAILAIMTSSRGPAVFRQERVGRGGRRFVLLKLRTMAHGSAGVGFTARDDSRVTAVGKLLRRSKLDELPELWNVVRGEMSLVGPRPEVPKYVDLGDPLWAAVLRARPGLTDPVAIHLRNEETLLAQAGGDREEFYREVLQPYKLRGHLAYLKRRSWATDLGVLFGTAIAVLVPSTAKPPSLEEVREAVRSSSSGARL